MTHTIGCSRGSCGFRYSNDAIRQLYFSPFSWQTFSTWWVRQPPEASDLTPHCLAAAEEDKVIVLVASAKKKLPGKILSDSLGYLSLGILVTVASRESILRWAGLSPLPTSSQRLTILTDFLCFGTWRISFLVFVFEYAFKTFSLPHISSSIFSVWELSQSSILMRSPLWLPYIGMFPQRYLFDFTVYIFISRIDLLLSLYLRNVGLAPSTVKNPNCPITD